MVLSYVTLTQSWFNVELAAFPPAWSISTEWFFYFAFIPLGLLIRRIRRPFLSLVLYSLMIGPAVLLLGSSGNRVGDLGNFRALEACM